MATSMFIKNHHESTSVDIDETDYEDIHEMKESHNEDFPEYLTSSAAYSFHFGVFGAQLFYNVFFPFNFMVMTYTGINIPARQFFWAGPTLTFQNFQLQFLLNSPAFLTWTVMGISIFKRDEFASAGMDSGMVVVMLYFFMSHRILIALKYASLSKKEYAKFMRSPPTVGHTYMKQLNILNGWLWIPESRISHELHLTAGRLGMDLTDMIFLVENSAMGAWKRTLGCTHCCSTFKSDSSYPEAATISLHDFFVKGLLQIQSKIKKPCTKFMSTATVLVAVMITICPLIPRISNGRDLLGDTFFSIYMTIGAMIATFMTAMPCIAIMISSFVSELRMCMFIKLITSLVRLDHTSRPVDRYPALALEVPGNIRCWLRSWVIVLRFGDRFRNRMDTNLYMAFITTGIMVVTLVVQGNVGTFKNQSTVFYMTIIYSAFVSCVVMALIAIKTKANTMLAKAEMYWHQHRVSIRENYHVSKHADTTDHDQRMEELEDLYSTVVDTIEAMIRLRPLHVFNFEASWSILWTFFTLSLGLIAYLTGMDIFFFI